MGEIGGDAGCGQFLRVWALRAGDHGGYSPMVMCKIAKGFDPSSVKVLGEKYVCEGSGVMMRLFDT